MPVVPVTPGPISRYPIHLSQRPGPSRYNRPQRPIRTDQNPIYLPESIDDSVPPIPPLTSVSPPIAHQYSSLADLLQQAGYKETRVFTPESEKRRIKKTLDEDDEINALYGAFGLSLGKSEVGDRVHTRQTITEPSQPMNSSSSLLRRLALQDVPTANTLPQPESRSPAADTWWGGGIAASIGRAAKAVIEPPRKSSFGINPLDLPPIGLADGGDTPKAAKTQSRMRAKRCTTAEPDQEQRPPQPLARPSRALTESPKRNSEFKASSPALKSLTDIAQPPLPAFTDDEIFGYSPLPPDYEDQCEDDSLYHPGDPFHVGSLGSSSKFSSEGIPISDDEGDCDNSMSTVGGQGHRIMLDAVEYDDELDSPTRHNLVLPSVNDEYQEPCEAHEPLIAQPEQPVRKYGDRATKLRMAKSTPALKRQPSWMDSLRWVITGRDDSSTIPIERPALPLGPLKISPVIPAAPALVTTAPVICDSASAEAIDLPAIPATVAVSSVQSASVVPLRLRSSLAALRTAVGLPERMPPESDTPVLTPRLDWKAQGNQFAGWERGKEGFNTPRRGNPGGSQLGARVTSGATIDYSKSFFYKPATPPHPSQGTQAEIGPSSDSEDVQSRKEPSLGKRRSIKSLRAALLIPVAPVPPVPAIPSIYQKDSTLSPNTPPSDRAATVRPPILAISSPGAWEAGLPPRELVLEGEEWDARDGGAPGDWGRRKSKGKRKTLKKRRSHDFY